MKRWPRGAAVAWDHWREVYVEVCERYDSVMLQVTAVPFVWTRAVDGSLEACSTSPERLRPVTKLARDLLRAAWEGR